MDNEPHFIIERSHSYVDYRERCQLELVYLQDYAASISSIADQQDGPFVRTLESGTNRDSVTVHDAVVEVARHVKDTDGGWSRASMLRVDNGMAYSKHGEAWIPMAVDQDEPAYVRLAHASKVLYEVLTRLERGA